MDLKQMLVQVALQTLQALLPVLGTLAGSLLSYLLYKLIGLIKNQSLQNEAKMAVAFAEQRFLTNADKLAYVHSFLKSRVGNSLSDQDLDHLLENAVLALKAQQNPAPPLPPAAPNAQG